ncbi:MAG: phosphatidylcholine/phosphatidylserine synthase [Phycisphaerae bacterium]
MSQSDKSKRRRGDRRLKAVAVLPSLATLGNLVCGFGAIYLCLLSIGAAGDDLAKPTLNNPRMESWFPTYLAIAAYLLFLAMFFDVLDGALARLTRKTTDFGAQLDSLADMVSFGVAPALLVLVIARPSVIPLADSGWLARTWWRTEWVMLAVYVCCAAIRLARFNVEHVKDEWGHRFFRGLPSPGAAAAVCTIVILHEEYIRGQSELMSSIVGYSAAPITMLIGLMMVGGWRYPHMLNTVLRGRRPLSHILIMMAVILGAGTIQPQLALLVLACGYALVGPLLAIRRRWFGGRTTEEPATAAASESSESSTAVN